MARCRVPQLTVSSFRYTLKEVSQVIRGRSVQRFKDHLAGLKINQFFCSEPAKIRYQRLSRRVNGTVCDDPGGSILKFCNLSRADAVQGPQKGQQYLK